MRRWSGALTPSFCVPEAPAAGTGIQRWTEAEFGTWARQGAAMEPKRVVRFVPASDAASRMFQALVARDPAAIEQLDARWAEFPSDPWPKPPALVVRRKSAGPPVERLISGQPKGVCPSTGRKTE